jgi:hypothetical protein
VLAAWAAAAAVDARATGLRPAVRFTFGCPAAGGTGGVAELRMDGPKMLIISFYLVAGLVRGAVGSGAARWQARTVQAPARRGGGGGCGGRGPVPVARPCSMLRDG